MLSRILNETIAPAADLTPKQAVQRIKHLRRIFDKDDVNKMNTNHLYYYQIQCGLRVTTGEYCIFALWTKKGIKHVRVEYDKTLWEKTMAEALKKFYHDCLLPEILDSRHNRNMPLREPQYVIQAQEEQKQKKTTKETTKKN